MRDPLYEGEGPEDVWVICKLCGEEMSRSEFEIHWAECDIVPFEEA